MNYKKIPKQRRQMKRLLFYFTMFTLLLICSCGSKPQSNNHASIDSLIVGKWKMVEYAGGYGNILICPIFLPATLKRRNEIS